MSGILTKLRPARQAAEDIRVVVDLDSLISEPVGFRFRGKIYQIQPVTTRQFMQMSQVLGELQSLNTAQKSGTEVHEETINAAFHRYVSAICPELTMELLVSMTLAQRGALLTLILRHATGTVDQPETEKKKTLMSQ